MSSNFIISLLITSVYNKENIAKVHRPHQCSITTSIADI